jgi:hypothetical protein
MVYRFCKKEHIPINYPQGGGENISSDEDEAGCPSKITSGEIMNK